MGLGRLFMKTELATQKNQSRGIIKIIALTDEGYRFNSFIHYPKELKQMLPTFVWSGEDIDRLEEWWSKRIEQLIAMKKPLAASALFDEFQLEQKSSYPRGD